ncbi:MAG: hypothetical protein Kow0099_09460 [Candidatus Abyssubacteria bacterium]
MLFEIIFSSEKGENGFFSYLKKISPEAGVSIIEHYPSVIVIEGEWDSAMSFLRNCQSYIQEHDGYPNPVTTVHIHS